MCRHIAYLGPPVALGELLTRPPHALVRQSWEPHAAEVRNGQRGRLRRGLVRGRRPGPGRYRRQGPIWADESFDDLARVVRSTALLAAVRDATERDADGEAAAAPFAAGRLLFSHNGAVKGWPGSLAPLAATLPPADLLALAARCDSALIWALVRHRVADGDDVPQAVADTVREVAEAAPGSRLNLLLTDGTTIVATAWGDTLWYLAEPGHRTVVASEPYDDDPHWREVPDRTLLVATRADVLLTPLKEPTE